MVGRYLTIHDHRAFPHRAGFFCRVNSRICRDPFSGGSLECSTSNTDAAKRTELFAYSKGFVSRTGRIEKPRPFLSPNHKGHFHCDPVFDTHGANMNERCDMIILKGSFVPFLAWRDAMYAGSFASCGNVGPALVMTEFRFVADEGMNEHFLIFEQQHDR